MPDDIQEIDKRKGNARAVCSIFMHTNIPTSASAVPRVNGSFWRWGRAAAKVVGVRLLRVVTGVLLICGLAVSVSLTE